MPNAVGGTSFNSICILTTSIVECIRLHRRNPVHRQLLETYSQRTFPVTTEIPLETKVLLGSL